MLPFCVIQLCGTTRRMLDMTPNTAVRLERELTAQILRGHHRPGARLPTVRELARHHAVNPSTVQRALARMEATGLVTARQGSGFRVNDPASSGDVSLVPAWLEALADQPAAAAAVLDEFLEVRRILSARLLVRHHARLRARVAELEPLATAVLHAGSDAASGGVAALRDADLAFARAVLTIAGNRVVLAIFHTAARVVTDVPRVAEAMYGDPAANIASLTEVMNALATLDGDALGVQVERILAKVDAGTVARYRAALAEGAP